MRYLVCESASGTDRQNGHGDGNQLDELCPPLELCRCTNQSKVRLILLDYSVSHRLEGICTLQCVVSAPKELVELGTIDELLIRCHGHFA
jgi:hypothetical protein